MFVTFIKYYKYIIIFSGLKNYYIFINNFLFYLDINTQFNTAKDITYNTIILILTIHIVKYCIIIL